MKRLSMRSSPFDVGSGATSPPWACQLIHVASDSRCLHLDLIALEPCPVARVPCPRFAPFTIRLEREGTDPSWDVALARWAEVTDRVTIVAGVTGSTAWLCLSGAERHLVLEVAPAA